MTLLRPLGLLLLLGTLGAEPPSPTSRNQTADLERLQQRYADLAKRMDAMLLEMRDIRDAFPSSSDPETLLSRWRALNVEGGEMWGKQWDVRTQYRQTLRGVYLYQGFGMFSDFQRGVDGAASRGGKFYAYETTVTEMQVNSDRFAENLKRENAEFGVLVQGYAARKKVRRNRMITAACVLAAAVLLGATSRARGRQKSLPPPTPAAKGTPPPAPAALQRSDLLGRGTLGEVREIVDAGRGRRTALKTLGPELLGDPEVRERLLAVARAVSVLKHPNIAALHSIEETGPLVCLAYEFIDGKTLARVLQEHRRLAWPAALLVLKGTGAALRYAHAQGVAHRDLKPANIMLTRANEVKVLDFALVDEARKSLSGQGWDGGGGTPPYAAPEQGQGRVSPGADLYALSVIFYEMLTGELPFKGPNYLAQKREAVYTPPSALVAGLPRGLDAFFTVALAPEPSRRFAGAEALTAAAEAAG